MTTYGSARLLAFTVAILVLINSAATRAIEIPASWRKLHELEDDTPPLLTEIYTADVFADWVGYGTRTWRLRPRGSKIPRDYPPRQAVHVVNLETGEHHSAFDLYTDLYDRLIGPETRGHHSAFDLDNGIPAFSRFVGNGGVVFSGSFLLYDNLRQFMYTGLRPEKSRPQRIVQRVTDHEFVVNDRGVLHSVDVSDVASQQTRLKELAIPQVSDMLLSVASKDHVVRWSPRVPPYSLALFDRETGELVWGDQTRRPVLGLSPKHVYMWSYRIVTGRGKFVLVRKAVDPPFQSESVFFPAPTFGAAVIDFNWPRLLLLVHQQASGVYLAVNVDLKRQSTKQFDFRLQAEDISVSEGNTADYRSSFRDKQSNKKYRLFGDARYDRLIVVSDRAVYSVPLLQSPTYQWPDWNWQPYRFEDSSDIRSASASIAANIDHE